jgi:hypothetical protein
MVIKNGKAPARKRQPIAASSSSKSKRSNSVPKNPVSRDNGKAADELDGNIVCVQGGALEGAMGDRVLETPRISEDTRGENLSGESVELTAITLHQPWASLVAKGWKQYETRDWPTNHRGLIVIHAGRKPKGKQELREHDKVVASFKDLLNEDCPYSSVIAIAELTDVICMTEEFIKEQSPTELRCGNWAVGRYAFKLENVRPLAPISATGKQGLWKFDQEAAGFDSLHLEPWNPADFSKVQHKAEADGQLNLLEFDSNEPPEPDDYPGDLEAFKKAYLAWVELQEGTAEEEYQHTTAEEIWNQSDNGNGSICAQELAQGSPTPGLNVGDDRPTSSANGTTTANQSSDEDSPTANDLVISKPWILGQVNSKAEGLASSQQVLPANPSAMTEIDSLPETSETVSPQSLPLSINCNPNLQSLKTLPDSSTAQNDQEATNFISLESLTNFPRAGTMSNGRLSAQPTLERPGVGKDYLLLRSPGALSGNSNQRPPGKNKLETQLIQLGLITNSEVANPEFLEAGYNLPVGWTNPQEQRTALELAQVQAQQLPTAPSLELLQEMEATAIVESPSATPCIGQLPPSDLKELNISPALPALDNIGSFSKDDLLNFAITAHESIAGIERSELELAMRKLNQARIAGTCLAEYKKKCRHGEFGESVSTVINLRTAQTYMSIAENWNLLAEASRETLLVDGQTLGINWARDTIAQSKKSLKSAAAPANPDDWRTPNTKEQPIINLVKQALGGQIWCDPCADAGHKVGAAVAFHKGDDGLKDVNIWRKTVFVNPPFSDPLPWVKKCCFSIARGDCSAAIMLMKAGTLSNQGTGNLIEKYASAVCHWRGRINFLNDEGVAVKGSDFDCVLVYFGDRLDLFKKAFEQRGTITTIQNRYSSVNNKHTAAATVPLVEEAQEVPAVPTAITSVKQEQELMQKELGLRTNGKTLLPDLSVNDRAKAEQLDPYNVDDRPFAIQVESVEVEDDSKWYEETAIGVVSRTEGFTTNQSAEIINKLLKADFKSRTRATLKKLSKEELADLLRYCDQELDSRK